MPGTYVVNYTDPSKSPIEIQPLTQNTDTSITMAGYRYPVYGEAIWENFLHLMENFAYSVAPPTPVTGQVWVDTSSPNHATPKVYDGALDQWVEIGKEINIGSTTPQFTKGLWFNTSTKALSYWNGSSWINTLCFVVANTTDYNDLVTDLNVILVKYGQPTRSTLSIATLSDWTSLVAQIKTLAEYRQLSAHVVNRLTAVTTLEWCSDSSISLFSTLRKFDVVIRALDQISQSKSDQVLPSCFEVKSHSAGYSLYRQRTTSWSTTVDHAVTFTFTSASHMNAFFETGGKITWNGDIILPASPNQTTIDWASFLSSVPNFDYSLTGTKINGTVEGVGFAQTGTTEQVVAIKYARTASYYTNYIESGHIRLYAHCPTTSTLRLRIELVDPDPYDVSGTLNSEFTIARVGPPCLPSASAPAFPLAALANDGVNDL